MLRTQDTIAVCDIETGELLPFSVPADFFTDPSNQNAGLCLGIAPANTPQPTHTAEDVVEEEELVVWTPDGNKWGFIVDVWISDTFDMLTTPELLQRYATISTVGPATGERQAC